MTKRASSTRNLSPNEQNMKENQEKEILDILQSNQYASIDELAQALFVSPSTIRRKLNALQQKGLITRTHGGAQINDEKNFFPSFTFRVHQNSFEKKKMALAAMKLIENGNLIFLDGTTSAFFIAEYLSDFKNLRVITNGVDTLSLLAKNNVAAYPAVVTDGDSTCPFKVGYTARLFIEKGVSILVTQGMNGGQKGHVGTDENRIPDGHLALV